VKYALLAYNPPTVLQRGPIKPEIVAVFNRPGVTSWMRLQHPDSATTISRPEGTLLLTDGPFVDSKEYLGGLFVVDVANLDEALTVATELQSLMSAGGAIEVRPILEDG
jgi:hypothetical protein